MRPWRLLTITLFLTSSSMNARAMGDEAILSAGREADPTAKTVAEIHEAEARHIPIEAYIKASTHYSTNGPVEVTVIVTNLFDTPLLMNARMLVNHPRLEGEMSFLITDANGNRFEIKRLVTPLTERDQDFVVLQRGESMQRTVDLADLFGLNQKGTYHVRVAYHNEVDYTIQDQKAWKGFVYSDPVDIQLD